MKQQTKNTTPTETGFYEAYAGFAKTLRTWLVAYGIGVPVLFASQATFATILREKDAAVCIICLFLFGVTLQVVAALLFKATMWYLYFGELYSDFQSTRRHRVSDWLSEQLWLEMCFDIGSVVMFAWATVWMLLKLVASTASSTVTP